MIGYYFILECIITTRSECKSLRNLYYRHSSIPIVIFPFKFFIHKIWDMPNEMGYNPGIFIAYFFDWLRIV